MDIFWADTTLTGQENILFYHKSCTKDGAGSHFCEQSCHFQATKGHTVCFTFYGIGSAIL